MTSKHSIIKSLLVKSCLFSLLLMPQFQATAQTDVAADTSNPQVQETNADVTTDTDSCDGASGSSIAAENDTEEVDESAVSEKTGSLKGKNANAVISASSSTLMYLSADPAKPTIKKGATVTVKITQTSKNGKTGDCTKLCKWSTSNKNVATVAGGKIKGISTGSANVYATFGGKKAGIYVTVISDSAKNELLRINAKPETTSIKRGKTVSVKVTATYGNGSTKDVTNSCTWNSTRTFVATVSRGTIRGVKAGVATIEAHFEGKTAYTVVTVK